MDDALEFPLSPGEPAYRQIAARLRRAWQEGRLRPGDRLPPVRELAARLGVHFNTVARAYRLLAREGWIAQRPRRGTVVLRPAPDPQDAWREEALMDLAQRFVQQARWLGYDDAAIVQAVTRVLGLSHERSSAHSGLQEGGA